MIGEAQTLSINGGFLRESEVIVEGNWAYVAFNSKGEDYQGAIPAIGISNLSKPVVKSEIFFSDHVSVNRDKNSSTDETENQSGRDEEDDLS